MSFLNKVFLRMPRMMQRMPKDTEFMHRTEDYRHGKLVIGAADYYLGMPRPPIFSILVSEPAYPTAN